MMHLLKMVGNGGSMVSKGLRAFTYQLTVKFGAGYYVPKTTELLINYTACCAFGVLQFSILILHTSITITYVFLFQLLILLRTYNYHHNRPYFVQLLILYTITIFLKNNDRHCLNQTM